MTNCACATPPMVKAAPLAKTVDKSVKTNLRDERAVRTTSASAPLFPHLTRLVKLFARNKSRELLLITHPTLHVKTRTLRPHASRTPKVECHICCQINNSSITDETFHVIAMLVAC